jgi:hypothetical protein
MKARLRSNAERRSSEITVWASESFPGAYPSLDREQLTAVAKVYEFLQVRFEQESSSFNATVSLTQDHCISFD